MKIVIAPDSFKESLSALEVCHAIQAGFQAVFPQANYLKIPMADGGEGTASALKDCLQGTWQTVSVHDPLMRPITAQYAMLPNRTAVIEMASASGLHLLAPNERNPHIASTYGVGEMIAHAIEQGAETIILGIGGSATNDGGAGMLRALGYQFLDEKGQPLVQGGMALQRLHHIDSQNRHTNLDKATITVACDVNNPLCGEKGASAVYAPQKGASVADVAILDSALSRYADITATSIGKDFRHEAGAGAAGGLGFALIAFLNAKLVSGVTLISEITELAETIAGADLVITGEGKMDFQTAMGKVASGVLSLAQTANVPIIAICGAVDDPNRQWREQGFSIATASIQQLDTLENTFANASKNIEITAYNLAMAMKLGQKL